MVHESRWYPRGLEATDALPSASRNIFLPMPYRVAKYFVVQGAISAFGQVFIFYTITGPGPLVCTTITTTRKFFTILLSVMLNPNNHLNNNQWIAVGLVFLGLGGEIAGKYQAKASKNSPTVKINSNSGANIKPIKSP